MTHKVLIFDQDTKKCIDIDSRKIDKTTEYARIDDYTQCSKCKHTKVKPMEEPCVNCVFRISRVGYIDYFVLG